MQALACSLRGEHDDCDTALASLGCHFKISRRVWDAATSFIAARDAGPASTSLSGHSGWVAVLDQALPLCLLSRLRHGLSIHAPFWDHHRYGDAATPFFSYLKDLVSWAAHLTRDWFDMHVVPA